MILAALLVFLLLSAAAVMLIWAAVADSRRAVTESRISERMGIEEDEAEVPVEFLARDADSWFDRTFYQLLLDAGSEMSPAAAMAVIGGMGLVAGAVAMVATEQPLVGFLAGMCGMALPVVFWMIFRARRLAAMRRLMPDALDQMADALYGGLTLDQAAEMVSLQTPKPLKREFAYCVSLLEMGQAPAAVMDRMARRVPVPEFRLFATAVQVHRMTGGNLAQLTTRLAASARDRLEWDRHLGSQTVTGRMSAIGMVLCGVIGFLVLSFMRPQYTEFFLTGVTGPRLLFLSFALAVLGGIWVARVVRIRY